MDQFVINWERNNTMEVDIKRGDKFRCILDVVMSCDNKIEYIKDKVYISDNDGCITDESGDSRHRWQNVSYFSQHFLPITGDVSISETPREITVAKRKFESGAVRDSNEGKSRPDLISPYFTERLGFRLAEGAKKYAERNWEKGIPDAAFLESLERHLVAYKMGKTDEDHAAAIAFNIMGIIHNEEVRKL